MSKQSRVFISYPMAARDLVEAIATQLRQAGLEVFYDKYSLSLGQEISSILFQAIQSSDYFVLFLDKDSCGQKWLRDELEHVLSKALYSRDISIIPVLLGKFRLPQSLALRTRFDMTRDPRRESERLVEFLKCAPLVNFSNLNAQSFEDLVYNLLKALRFSKIESTPSFINRGYDFRAATHYKDPFGIKHEVNWLVQIKFYREARPDISSLRQLSYQLSDLPANTNGLLITNGQLTSTASEWLDEIKTKRRSAISVVDGVQLKDLVLRHPPLVHQFFRKGA